MTSNPIIARAAWAYAMLAKLASYLQSPLLLAMRLYWGWQFFQTGKGKLGDLDKVAGFFTKLHIPAPKFSAFMAGSTECFGGLFLLLGLGSRLITIPLIFTMIIAYITADSDAVKNIFEKPDDFVTAAPFLFLLTSVIVFVFGPGMFSLDALIGYLTRRKFPNLPNSRSCPVPRGSGMPNS